MAKDEYHYGLGRRKESVATARIYTSGTAAIEVNGQNVAEYFGHTEQQERIMQPLKLLDMLDKHRVTLHVKGGGKSGQADAARLALANALVEMNEDVRSTLKRAGYLKRDSRAKERKKYGLKRARKAPQFTKR